MGIRNHTDCAVAQDAQPSLRGMQQALSPSRARAPRWRSVDEHESPVLIAHDAAPLSGSPRIARREGIAGRRVRETFSPDPFASRSSRHVSVVTWARRPIGCRVRNPLRDPADGGHLVVVDTRWPCLRALAGPRTRARSRLLLSARRSCHGEPRHRTRPMVLVVPVSGRYQWPPPRSSTILGPSATERQNLND